MSELPAAPVLLRKPEPDPKVVEFLEGVLARAKAGDIDGVWVLHTSAARIIGQGSAGRIDPADMIYNLELWKFRYFRKDESK